MFQHSSAAKPKKPKPHLSSLNILIFLKGLWARYIVPLFLCAEPAKSFANCFPATLIKTAKRSCKFSYFFLKIRDVVRRPRNHRTQSTVILARPGLPNCFSNISRV
jgi:hypothetical protein